MTACRVTMAAAPSPQWFNSSYSNGAGGEYALAKERIHVRDSKNTGVPEVAVRHRAWRSLVQALKGDHWSP